MKHSLVHFQWSTIDFSCFHALLLTIKLPRLIFAQHLNINIQREAVECLSCGLCVPSVVFLQLESRLQIFKVGKIDKAAI